MKTALRTTAALALALGCLAGAGTQEARAQYQVVPHGPYWTTLPGTNQKVPIYYPRVVNNYGVSSYSSRPRLFPGRWVFTNGGFRPLGRRGGYDYGY